LRKREPLEPVPVGDCPESITLGDLPDLQKVTKERWAEKFGRLIPIWLNLEHLSSVAEHSPVIRISMISIR
jgi:hypothetical protein